MKSRTAFKQRQICLEQYGGTDCPACRRTRQMPMTSRARPRRTQQDSRNQILLPYVRPYRLDGDGKYGYHPYLTRICCVVNISPGLGDSPAIQTGNLADFANVPITTEIFVKDRWAGLEPGLTKLVPPHTSKHDTSLTMHDTF
ncbi:hypothetical protein B0H14DRAFT_3592657 [Mycena olivaceomarginata]|nr:hypothetical protein B0H14DRAFT_3592657 [Mycena olivaceomarginata]